MTVYLPNEIAIGYTLGSVVYKRINGTKVYGYITDIIYTGYRCKKTHIKFKAKRFKNEAKNQTP